MRALALLSFLGFAAGVARADAPCAELAHAVNLASSPDDDRRVFCAFAKDLVVGSCCQATLHDCLVAHPSCARAQVLAQVGFAAIASGATEEAAAAAAAHYLDGLAWSKRHKIDLAGVPCRGRGPVTIEEFSDFDCPHCAYAQGILAKLAASHPNLRLCVLAFPVHAHSVLAAAAALWAAKQGRYWELAKALYATQDERETLDEPDYKAELVKVGAGLGLDPKGLRAALAGGPALELARAQGDAAKAMKLDGTPTFFLDGHRIDEAGLASLEAAIADEAAYRKAHPPRLREERSRSSARSPPSTTQE